MFGRNRGLFVQPLLGVSTFETRSYSPADAADVRQTLYIAGKSDALDAEAICEAVTQPTMRFVEIKSEEQQALLSLHQARDFVVRQRTQLINMLRSLATEFGITIARGVARAIDIAKWIVKGGHAELPELAQEFLRVLSRQLIDLHNRLGWYKITMRIKVSGQNRINRPDTRPLLKRHAKPHSTLCYAGAIHTRHSQYADFTCSQTDASRVVAA